jgi:pimeloyl-ACP methyl ester carboxylesterase
MKCSSLFSLVAALSMSGPVFAQECQPDYGQVDLKELRLSDDYRLAYLEYGTGEPVVFIHGAVGDYRNWVHQVEGLRRDYRVIALSLRASSPNALSRSPASPATGNWSDTDDVIELIEHLGAGPVHLIGHSSGGAVALDVAVRRPDLLRSLVLEEPAAGLGELSPEMQSLLASVRDRIGRGDARTAVRDFLSFASGDGFFDSQSAECQQIFVENAATLSIGQPPPDTTCEAAGTIQAPVLYLQGEISPQRDSPFEMCLPPHDTKTIRNASHGVHTDKPRQFNRALRDFIGRH